MIYNKIKDKPKSFLSYTSLKLPEFTTLCNYFELEWVKFYKYHTLEGKKRKHPNSKPYKDTRTLPSIEDKLFFFVSYFKVAPLQEIQAVNFELSQAKVSIWLKILTPLVVNCLDKMKMSPSRKEQQLAEVLKKNGSKVFNLDATERLTERDKDKDNQKEYFSGKHKEHTLKNNLISNDSQEILFLGQTHPGTIHDKTMAVIDLGPFPDDSIVRLDLGYLGLELAAINDGHITKVIPFKKPKKAELTALQKAFNKTVAQARVVVEHAIGGVKRLRIVKDRIRHIRRDMKDTIIFIAVGIHNLRVRSPYRKYNCNKEPFAHVYACARE